MRVARLTLRLQWPVCVHIRNCSWTSQRIRSTFIDYYKAREHTFVPSSSVIPKRDEGTYFVNAGMNQFKPIFLGSLDVESSLSSLRRAVNSQKCIRVGGKHNDLEDVGRDTYHHTFFEMLGSWSFGDYFKHDACKMAWQLLVDEYRLPVDRLYVTYFGGDEQLGLEADEETKDIWLQIGVSADRVLTFGVRDNLWAMGDTGPCGPCTEIHYDHLARPSASHLVNQGSPDLVELWNLVFMQYDRQVDGSLRRLPRQHVDTGMGLERLCAVLQGSMSNYDTDLFTPIFKHIEKECGVPSYEKGNSTRDIDVAYRIVADHLRMFTITIADGFLPGRTQDSQKRLRSIMQRAFKQARRAFGAQCGFVGSLVPCVVDSLGDAFPELRTNPQAVIDVVNATEERYWKTVEKGKTVFPRAIKKYGLKPGDILSGEQTYEICDGRFGAHLPVDVIQDLAEDYNLSINIDEYQMFVKQINEQNVTSPQRTVLNLDQYDVIQLQQNGVPVTDDSYKYTLTSDTAPLVTKVTAVMTTSGLSKQILSGEKAGILLEKTNFYAEQGGQVSDTGVIEFGGGAVFRVDDVQSFQRYVLHIGVLEGADVTAGAMATLKPNMDRRLGCTLNHSATHLLNFALANVIGHTKQHSSTVYPDKLTFQFSSLKTSPLSTKETQAISDTVNQQIRDKLPLYVQQLPLTTAKAIQGMRMLDHAVYSHTVRVVSVGVPVSDLAENPTNSWGETHSLELCSGTHVTNTSDIGAFVITSVTGGEQGVRSVTAATGQAAIQARANAADIREQLQTLQSYINENREADRWKEMANQIEARLGGEQCICKLERDSILSDLNKINLMTNPVQRGKERLVQEIKQCMESSHPDLAAVVLHVTHLQRLRDINDVIIKQDFSLPLLLFGKQKQGSFAACYVPQSYPKSCEEWAAFVCDCLPGSELSRPKGKHGNDERLRAINIPKFSSRLLLDETVINNIKQFWT